jgi:hypothetical protein
MSAPAAHEGQRPGVQGGAGAATAVSALKIVPEGGRSPATQQRDELMRTTSTPQQVEVRQASTHSDENADGGAAPKPVLPRRPSVSTAATPREVAIKQVAKMFMVRVLSLCVCVPP